MARSYSLIGLMPAGEHEELSWRVRTKIFFKLRLQDCLTFNGQRVVRHKQQLNERCEAESGVSGIVVLCR
jgi:hypothetical protein